MRKIKFVVSSIETFGQCFMKMKKNIVDEGLPHEGTHWFHAFSTLHIAIDEFETR